MTIRIGCVWAALAMAPLVVAQRNGALSPADAAGLLERTLQLMESATVVVPGLAQASAPAVEGARQALVNLKITPGQSAHTYAFVANVRAYLAVADATPKPYPFPETGARQLAELRDDADRLEAYFRALLDMKETQLRSPDRDNLRRYREANEKVGPPSADRPRVVFLGDSITDGWRLNEYFEGRDFINRGISGQITGEMLGRMKADVLDLQPAAVLILAGTNDLAREVPLVTIENNYAMLATLASANGINWRRTFSKRRSANCRRRASRMMSLRVRLSSRLIRSSCFWRSGSRRIVTAMYDSVIRSVVRSKHRRRRT